MAINDALPLEAAVIDDGIPKHGMQTFRNTSFLGPRKFATPTTSTGPMLYNHSNNSSSISVDPGGRGGDRPPPEFLVWGEIYTFAPRF